MSNRILSDYRKINSHREIAKISLVIPPKFISHKARILGEFDSRNQEMIHIQQNPNNVSESCVIQSDLVKWGRGGGVEIFLIKREGLVK